MNVDLPIFFAEAARLGCSCVELRHTQINPWSTEAELHEVMQCSQKYDLPIEMVTMRKGQLNEEADFDLFLQYLELARKLKCRQIKVRGHNIQLLRRAATEACNHNITIGMNNHIGTPLATRKGTVRFFNRIAHDNVKLLFDPSHLWINNDPADTDFIESLLGRISYLVVQDYVEGKGADFTIIGNRSVRPTRSDEEGAVGYRPIIKMLERLNAQIPIGLVQPGALYWLHPQSLSRCSISTVKENEN